MKLRMTGLVALAAIALVIGLVSSAFAIEAFHERFEWGDLSQPTTLHARVSVIDPYDKAGWLNIAVFGGNSESGLEWQTHFPGKNLKVYPANDAVWNQLKSLGTDQHGQAVGEKTRGSKYTLVEVVIKETSQNHRVLTSIKKIKEIAGTPANPRSIHSLRTISQAQAIEDEHWPANMRMRYDVMIPGGPPIAGFIPNSNQSAHMSKRSQNDDGFGHDTNYKYNK